MEAFHVAVEKNAISSVSVANELRRHWFDVRSYELSSYEGTAGIRQKVKDYMSTVFQGYAQDATAAKAAHKTLQERVEQLISLRKEEAKAAKASEFQMSLDKE